MFSKVLRFSLLSVFCVLTAISSVYAHEPNNPTYDGDFYHQHVGWDWHYHRNVVHWEKGKAIDQQTGELSDTSLVHDHAKPGFIDAHSFSHDDSDKTGYEVASPPDTQPDTQPGSPPDTQPGSPPDTPPASQPENQPQTQPENQPETGTDPVTATVQEPGSSRPPNQLSATGPISFSELMFTSKGGLRSMPQWIELYNNSDTATVNLNGWQLTIEARDADGTHRHAVITLEELRIPPNKTALIVTWSGRHSDDIQDSRVYRFFSHHSGDFEQNTHRNMVLGREGFFLKLADPNGDVSDTVGNIDGDPGTEDEPSWEIPAGTTQDGARTSLFRRYAKRIDYPLDGIDANNWHPAANFRSGGDSPALAVSRYWGSSTDIGNPGYKGAGALPVALSSFRAVLKETGVVLSWTTESELENAGFNILRSVSKNGHFLKVNPSLIQGAGTTSERNAYTWTDTTAKPNTVYFYQIEDISYSGERARFGPIRLKGYVSAQGKLATRWADLKDRE